MSGHSKIRNKVIANVFSKMGLVEAWGSGIRRILNVAEKYKLPVPKFEAFDDMFRVNLYRNVQDNMNGSIGENIGDRLRNDSIRLNDTQVKIIESITENKYLSAAKLAEITGISKRNVENNIKKLKELGVLVRHGSPKSGYWEIVE